MSKSRKIWLLKVKYTFCNHNDVQNDMIGKSNSKVLLELELHAYMYQIINAMIFVTTMLSVHPL